MGGPAPPARLTAGGLSLLVHLSLLVGFAILWRAPASRGIVEAERPIGITVIAPASTAPAATRPAPLVPPVLESGEANSAVRPAERLARQQAALPDADWEEARQAESPGLSPAGKRVAIPPAVAARLPGLTPGPPVGRGRPLLPGDSSEAAIAAARAAAQSQGPDYGVPVAVALFGSAPAHGRTFVFLLDRSQSMGSEGLDVLHASRAQLAQALQKLAPQNRYQVIAYNDRCVYLHSRGLAEVAPESPGILDRFLENLAAFGGTDHVQGLLSALALRPDVIFLLTDGGDPEITSAQVRELEQLAAGRTAIHCLQFGYEPPVFNADALRQLARRTRGSYGFVQVAGGAGAGPGRLSPLPPAPP